MCCLVTVMTMSNVFCDDQYTIFEFSFNAQYTCITSNISWILLNLVLF